MIDKFTEPVTDPDQIAAVLAEGARQDAAQKQAFDAVLARLDTGGWSEFVLPPMRQIRPGYVDLHTPAFERIRVIYLDGIEYDVHIWTDAREPVRVERWMTHDASGAAIPLRMRPVSFDLGLPNMQVSEDGVITCDITQKDIDFWKSLRPFPATPEVR